MYFTTNDAIEPADLAVLKGVLEDIRIGRDIAPESPATHPLAQEVIELWQAGFRDADELRAMMAPDFI